MPGPPPGDIPDPGIEPASLMSPALADGFFTTSATGGTGFTGNGNFHGNVIERLTSVDSLHI